MSAVLEEASTSDPMFAANAARYQGRHSGVHVSQLRFDPGTFLGGPSAYHALCMRVGGPSRGACIVGDASQQQRSHSVGDIDVVPAGYCGFWVDDGDVRILQVQLQTHWLQQAALDLPARQRGGASLPPHLQLRDARVQTLMQALEAEAQAGYDNGRLYTESLGHALALHLARNLLPLHPARTAPPGFGLRQRRLLADYIEAHLDQDLGLAQLQALVNLGASQFKVLFRNSFGSPVHAYVIQRRVQRARQLIEADQCSLAQIALETGFADQSHMARCLRRALGLSPTQLRQK